jgi:hypothetical protein
MEETKAKKKYNKGNPSVSITQGLDQLQKK